jgi:hypothetical protein
MMEAMSAVPEKYEREIDDILRKSSFSPPRGPGRPPGWKTGFASEWQRNLTSLSPTRLLAFGLVLALVGYVLREFAPSLGATVSLIALVLLLSGLALSMSRRSSQRSRNWRGRSLDGPSAGAELWQDLKKRWQNWRRGRGDSRWR